MNCRASIDLSCAPAEALMGVRDNVAPGVPIDAISMACDRAIAVLYLLSGQFMESADECARYSDAIIFNAITDVQGTIEQIRSLAEHGHATTVPEQPAGGGQ